MAILKVTNHTLQRTLYSDKDFYRFTETSFVDEAIREEADLQRLLVKSIEVISEDILVISNEFHTGAFGQSNREIDVLGIDLTGRLVIIELKRTESGGHMELQALRYAALIKDMSPQNIIETYGSFAAVGLTEARARILRHAFGAHHEDVDGSISLPCGSPRIILVSSDYSEEILRTVAWLGDFNIDIELYRWIPRKFNSDLYLNVFRVDVPESIGRHAEAAAQRRRNDELTPRFGGRHAFWDFFFEQPEITTSPFCPRRGRNYRLREQKLQGPLQGCFYKYTITENCFTVELQFNREACHLFDKLITRRTEIEGKFGGELIWAKKGRRIRFKVADVGWCHSKRMWVEPIRRSVLVMQRLKEVLDAAVDDLLDGGSELRSL